MPQFSRAWLFTALTAVSSLAGCADLPFWMIVQRQSAITDYRHFDNAPIERAERESPLPDGTAAGLRLPEMPEPFDAAMERSGTVAFVVVQHGQVLLERYYNGYSRESIATSFSVAKSMVSALVGIALSEGRIHSVDDPITRYLPELERNEPRFARVTLRHLLEMRSGISFNEDYRAPWSDAAAFYLTPDIGSKLAGLRIECEPGRAYHYSSGDTQLLGTIVQRATGVPLPRYLQDKIWQPMGAAYAASWSLDSPGRDMAKAFCCVNARALDYARFGLVYLNGGRLNGVQIVPADWVRRSTEVRERSGGEPAARWNLEEPGTPRAAFYTWQWRRVALADAASELGVKPAADFYAEGVHGQFIYIAPEQDMVIVRLGRRFGEIRWPGLMGRVAKLNPG